MLSLLAVPLLASYVAAQNAITVSNRCGMRIAPRVYDRTANSYTVIPDLDPGASFTVTVPANFEGVIFQGSNPGRPGFAGATQAGFSLRNNLYFILTGEGFNTGISIGASLKQFGVFCTTNTCDDPACPAYVSFPTSFPTISINGPSPPLYACGGSNTPYSVTFCPSGTGTPFPPPTPPPSTQGVQLHPNGDNSKCLDLAGNDRRDGAAVQIYDCNGSGAQQWVLNDATTSVKLAGTNFCLDAGTNPGNGIGMKIWTCYDNLPAQTWYLTQDRRIALKDQGLCLDLTDGSKANGKRMQVWSCSSGNANQVWT